MLIATTLCAGSQLFGHHTSTSDQCWHSPDLATENKHPDPGRGLIHTTTIPTVANSKVSKTNSLMSCLLYAAPVTHNVEMSTTAAWRREVFLLFGAVLIRAVRAVTLCCLFPLWELEPLHREGRSRSRFIMCGAVWFRAVRTALHRCSYTQRELEPFMKGDYVYFVSNLCLH